MKVDFATFVYSGDRHRLTPEQLEKQVKSNDYDFDNIIVIHQECEPIYQFEDAWIYIIEDIDRAIQNCSNIDIGKYQYVSDTDKQHTWKNHVVNHLTAAYFSDSDYIVFADSDCWMISQPTSWVEEGISKLKGDSDIWMVSPNDGEPARKTRTISQQMFMVGTEDFLSADFNQPGYTGNPRDYSEMPEYHAMLEGRIHHYLRSVDKYRYVLPAEWRYWHHNRLREDGSFETDLSKYA